MENKNLILYTSVNEKIKLLILSLLLDLIGMIPFIDIVWAPISVFLLSKMYKGTTGKVAGIVGFIEELLPGTDFVPTFTITWIYTYIIHGKQNP
ncbi:MAG: hypothetical protein ACOVQ2_07280 [Flavobacterium sp.]